MPLQSADSPDLNARAAELAEELVERWRGGRPCRVEDILALHPELAHQPQAAVPLIYEEICLRQEQGENISSEEYRRRFPRWVGELDVLFQCHRLLKPAPVAPLYPPVGEALGGFRLLAELGRGLTGRVFLATQSDLADRPVVLKLTPLRLHLPAGPGNEHLTLARLQHTHIVPLLFVQEEPALNLQILCMPYFGGASLARLLADLPPGQPALASGRQLLEILDRHQAASPIRWSGRGFVRPFLAQASIVQTVCWIGACLADALHHAHRQGLVHLDVKASNVLLTADGQPMLLDFHLSREALTAGSAAPDSLGGTPDAMAPEQQAALVAVRSSKPLTVAVDGRADVYSLALLLDKMLNRRDVPVGLADILARCLAANPDDRYASAAELANDLRRQLANMPLQGVRNRSWRERWRKWRRRRPHGLSLLCMLSALLLTAATATALAWTHVNQQRAVIRGLLQESQQKLSQQQYGEALASLHHGQVLADSVAGSQELKAELARLIAVAEQAQAAQELHHLADQIRFLTGDDFLSPQRVRALETQCRALWDKREQILKLLTPNLAPAQLRRVQADLLDLAILGADMQVRQAPPKQARLAHQRALTVLGEAEALLGASGVLRHEQRLHSKALGIDMTGAEEDGPALSTAWEHCAMGRSLLRAGRLPDAAAHFTQALDLDPAGLWPNYYRGLCAYRQGRHQQAVMAFSACAALVPDAAGVFFNRALALESLGSAEQALDDYDRALKLDTRLAPAALNRGLIHFRAGRHAQAVADLDLALALGADPATVHYNLAIVHLAQHDLPATRASIERALRAAPDHQQARQLSDELKQQP
jgi:serine/threonine protein kinase